MHKLYAVVEKETNTVIGFKVSTTFPRNGNNANLAYISHNVESGEIVLQRVVTVFLSTAKGFVDKIDMVPKNSVHHSDDLDYADYYMIVE